MNRIEASEYVNTQIKVTLTEISRAKDFILHYCRENLRNKINTSQIYTNFVNHQGISEPTIIHFSPNEDTQQKLRIAAKYFTMVLAAIESINSLIHQDVLCGDSSIGHWSPSVQYEFHSTTGGLNFDESFTLTYPQRVWVNPSFRTNSNTILSDPGMYINAINLTNADDEVLEAIRDSILCFKNELYRASLTMLGKAMEGAWIELGLSLVKYVYHDNQQKMQRETTILQSNDSISKKMKLVLDVYKNKALTEEVIRNSEIQISEIDSIFCWSDILRDARNAIHFGVRTTFPNNYEKTATMLLGASKNLPKIYHVKRICDNMSNVIQ